MSDAPQVRIDPEAKAYPCPQCGARTTLDPGTDSLACAHCGAVTRIELIAAPIHEHDLRDAISRARTRPADQLTANGKEVMCKNCGARTIVTQQATRCPFCDEAMVIAVEHADVTLVPESVLPFALDRNRASEAFATWLSKRWLAPFDLVKRARREGLDGVYLPYWTYDSVTTTQYTGQRGDHYYVTETYTDGEGKRQTRTVQRTNWYPAAGTVEVGFDDVLICATPSLPAKLIHELEPWDLHDLRPYDGRYLAGFIAERYRVGLEEGFALAERRMDPEIRKAIHRDIGGDVQMISSMHVHHRDTTFKHILLPLWLSSFRYGQKVYRVTVNARTGQVAGERPWSVFKIVALVIVALAIIAAIVYARQ